MSKNAIFFQVATSAIFALIPFLSCSSPGDDHPRYEVCTVYYLTACKPLFNEEEPGASQSEAYWNCTSTWRRCIDPDSF